MVKSGLVNHPDVSHYRLAIHLLAAFVTFAYIFLVALELIYHKKELIFFPSIKNGLQFLLLFLFIQIIYGAFVAGLNAGFIYNTWPKMGEKWVADSVTTMKPLWVNFVDGVGDVQFIHRYLAYGVIAIVIYLIFLSKKFKVEGVQKKSLQSILIVVVGQFILGVFTLIYSVPVWLGVVHQLMAFILLGNVIHALSLFRR